MPARDRPAVDVGFLEVGAGLLLPGENDRSERLVDLEEVDAPQVKAGALEDRGRAGNWSLEHQHGVGTDHSLGADARAWSQSELLRLLQRHQQDGRGSVRDLARV